MNSTNLPILIVFTLLFILLFDTSSGKRVDVVVMTHEQSELKLQAKASIEHAQQVQATELRDQRLEIQAKPMVEFFDLSLDNKKVWILPIISSPYFMASSFIVMLIFLKLVWAYINPTVRR
jgi:hypothetical protein